MFPLPYYLNTLACCRQYLQSLKIIDFNKKQKKLQCSLFFYNLIFQGLDNIAIFVPDDLQLEKNRTILKFSLTSLLSEDTHVFTLLPH